MKVIGRRSVQVVVRTAAITGAMEQHLGTDVTDELVRVNLAMEPGDRQGRHVLVQPGGPPRRQRGQVDDDWLRDRTSYRSSQIWLVAFVGRPPRRPRRVPGHHRPNRR